VDHLVERGDVCAYVTTGNIPYDVRLPIGELRAAAVAQLEATEAQLTKLGWLPPLAPEVAS
jgi:hypothetical protein